MVVGRSIDSAGERIIQMMRAALISLILLLPAAGAAEELPPFDKSDRILILAAHPDDETIGAAGVIEKAIKAGAAVKVVLYTNGDNNEPAFIIYETRLTFRKGEFLHMGEVRRQEAISAMNYLGLNTKDLTFLGYPDSGTQEIFTKYWGNTKPFKGFLTRTSKVPYPECLSPGAPYVGESILRDLKKVIRDFKPTKIFTTHPADRNGDHRSLYLFLRVALWDLEGKIKPPEIYPYLIHLVGWPKPRGYHPELSLVPPESIAGVSWAELPLTEKEIDKKRTAISYYKSEIEYDPPYLFTFARKNEPFGDYTIIQLKEGIKGDGIKWFSADPSNGVSYAREGSDLYVRLNLKRKVDKDIGMSVFLLGYSRKADFAAMPKMIVSIDAFGIHIKNKREAVNVKDAGLSYEGNALVLKMPLEALGDPDYLFANVRAADLSAGQMAWRILELNGK